MRTYTLLALAASLSLSDAVFQGFNYGDHKSDGTKMQESDWKAAFSSQVQLAGTNGGFTSARLYTMRDPNQASDGSEPISALKVADADKTTTLLLGIWASAGQEAFNVEIEALKKSIKLYPNLASQIAGISVGSEDLYRNSGIANKTKPHPGSGVGPGIMMSYVNQVRAALTDDWAGVKVGHVDTWTAFTNSDNSFIPEEMADFIKGLDFLGVDAYPYYEGTVDNDISRSTELFNEAFQKVEAVAGDVEIWITETGWPTKGVTIGHGVPSSENAKKYWQNVGCPNFGKVNTWWYIYDDHLTPTSFGVVNSLDGGATNWDLSCDGFTSVPDSSVLRVVSSASNSVNATATSSGTYNRANSTTVTGISPSSTSTSSTSDGPGSSSVGISLPISVLLALGGTMAAIILTL